MSICSKFYLSAIAENNQTAKFATLSCSLKIMANWGISHYQLCITSDAFHNPVTLIPSTERNSCCHPYGWALTVEKVNLVQQRYNQQKATMPNTKTQPHSPMRLFIFIFLIEQLRAHFPLGVILPQEAWDQRGRQFLSVNGVHGQGLTTTPLGNVYTVEDWR